MAATGGPGVTVDPLPAAQWVRQQHRNSVLMRQRGYSGSFTSVGQEYWLDASFDWVDPSATYCRVIELPSSNIASTSAPLDATPEPSHFKPSTTGIESSTSVAQDATIYDDAAAFADAIRNIGWQPKVWADEGEIVFEWINGDKHAVVSIEGDGVLGYTILVDGQFKAGSDASASAHAVPKDLLAYLA